MITSSRKLWLVAGLAIVLVAVSSAARAAGVGNLVVDPHSTVSGLTYGEWGAAWWQWVLAIPPCSTGPIDPNHPTACAGTPAPNFDPTGASCGLDQSGPVWFLAGTAYNTETFGAPTRSCTIPAGKYIFFPIINLIDDWPCPPAFHFNPAPGKSLEDFLTNDANTYFTPVPPMDVEVDGVTLPQPFRYRATSPLVGFTADPGWAVNDPCITGTPEVGVADGFWVMLRPLSVGHHTLHFRGGASPGFVTEVTYHLTITP